jgi:uncharacterized protein YhbP (UPF0306 family)
MSGETAARIAAFLDAHHVMSLATCGGDGPHAANVFYARDGFALLWLSDPASRHSIELESEPRVAATVAPDYLDFAEIRGVQMHGRATRLDGDAGRAARKLLEARYAFLRKMSLLPQALVSAYARISFYRLEPQRLVLIDNTRGFGHKETLEVGGG